MRLPKILSPVFLLIALTMPAFAAQVDVGRAWFRALPAGLPAAGYFTLRNTGDEDAVLTGVESPACGMLMMHESVDTGGMGRMAPVARLTVPAHGKVQFKPGGYHLMCVQPSASMKPGAVVTVTLLFADGTKTVATFAVKNAKGE